VTIIEATTEVWRFDCGRCGESWAVAYRKRRFTDSSGATFEYYYLDDTPAVSPQAPPVCRACGYVFVHGHLEPAG
jgi:ribosomal protein S27AE